MLNKLDMLVITLRSMTGSLHRDDEGATAVEYGLMVALIAAVIITAVALIGTNLDTLFTDVAGEITTVTP